MIPKARLSILIPTVHEREEDLRRLVQRFQDQAMQMVMADIFDFNNSGPFGQIYFEPNSGLKGIRIGNDIEIIWYADNKEISIGEKRQVLYQQASGKYSVQWDDDDDIADDGLELIIGAMQNDPDVICYGEKCVIDGNYFSSDHSIKYHKWEDNVNGFNYVRCPFFKDVIKTEIALRVPIPFIRWNEDEQFSMAIKPFLKTECHIEKEIYYYIHNSSNPVERYGLDK